MSDNPYMPPVADDCRIAWKPPRRVWARPEIAKRFALVGFLGGSALGGIGYLLLTAVIELALTPPFKSPPSYGQFSVVVIGLTGYMALFGLAMFVVPYVSWIGYIPIHFLGLFLIWQVDGPFFLAVEWTEAPIVALVTMLLFPFPASIGFSVWNHWVCNEPKQSDVPNRATADKTDKMGHFR